jgi:hypothetical protein
MLDKLLKPEWVVPIAIAAGSFTLSAYSAYSHNDRQIEHRLTVVEQQTTADHEDIHHVRDQVDRLVEWAMGHK